MLNIWVAFLFGVMIGVAAGHDNTIVNTLLAVFSIATLLWLATVGLSHLDGV